MTEKSVFLAALLAAGVGFAVLFARALRRARPGWPGKLQLGIGFVTDFLDTLGIGSFATTTSAFRLSQQVDDRLIPGTLNVGHALPTLAQAFIYITLIDVDVLTLASLVAAAALGAWLGAAVVSRWSRRAVRLGMGVALSVAAVLMTSSALSVLPRGGEALGLSGARLAAGIAGNFALGALMTAGIGLYAPCMVLVSLLGMGPATAFPIMMGSCALLMPAASVRFVREGAYDPRAALGLTLAGIPGVLVAAYIVRSLPLGVLRWLVVGVVVYTAVTLLAAARAEPDGAA
jgi:uncharacterized membrane protein YfcA